MFLQMQVSEENYAHLWLDKFIHVWALYHFFGSAFSLTEIYIGETVGAGTEFFVVIKAMLGIKFGESQHQNASVWKIWANNYLIIID